MATELRISDVETALIQALKDGVPAVTDIAGISSSDVDKDGQLVAAPPAIRVLFAQTTDQPTGVSRTVYETEHLWNVFCGARSLKSTEDERLSVYEIASNVRAAVAGLKLTLADQDGTETEPMELRGAEIVQADSNGMWLRVDLAVAATVQFVRS